MLKILVVQLMGHIDDVEYNTSLKECEELKKKELIDGFFILSNAGSTRVHLVGNEEELYFDDPLSELDPDEGIDDLLG